MTSAINIFMRTVSAKSEEDFRKEIKNINDILKNPEEPAEKKGLLLRSIVDRIVYEKASGTMYFDFFVS